MFKVAVIGGGINGLFVSWQLSLQGFKVELFESGIILQQTSSASSKLLHGGIRYLEQGHFGLVRESLKDRAWWLNNVADFCHPINICIPYFRNNPRSLLILYLGAFFYRLIAGKHSIGISSLKGRDETRQLYPDINSLNLLGSVSFYDAQMNEERLGAWVAEQAKSSGVKINEHTKVDSFTSEAEIITSRFGSKKYDFIVNAAGPWAAQLNEINNIQTKYYLRLIRGSHLILKRKVSGAFLFQESNGSRVVFVLPYLGKTLVGTTEVPQSIDDNIECSDEERSYLLNIFNKNFSEPVSEEDIETEFSGLRPIVAPKSKQKENYFSYASREAKLEISGKILTIYGGKWTSAPSLSKKVVKKMNKIRRSYA
jgi:glycerol-3-phosphate dehydrogenase